MDWYAKYSEKQRRNCSANQICKQSISDCVGGSLLAAGKGLVMSCFSGNLLCTTVYECNACHADTSQCSYQTSEIGKM